MEEKELIHKRLLLIYKGIISRTTNPKNPNYKRYGARGIKICEEWLNNFEKFKEWALNNGYQINLTIDRIDNDKGYCPDNCRWITRELNTARINNKEDKITTLTYKGETKTIKEWSKKIGLSADVIRNRLYLGWSTEKILETPLKRKKRGYDKFEKKFKTT